MDATRSPFLGGALAWINNGTIPDRCDTCAFEWTIQSAAAVDRDRGSARPVQGALADRDGMVAPDDGGWNATAYLWHLTDLAGSWSERWVQIEDQPGSLLAGWDPDVLAAARNYRNLPTVPAIWALDQATARFVHLTESSTTAPRSNTATGVRAPLRTVCAGLPTSTSTTSSMSRLGHADRSGPLTPR